MKELHKCMICQKWFELDDCHFPKSIYRDNRCKYCAHDMYFKNLAICYILNVYDLRCGEYSDDLLEIETIRAKTRWVIRGGETKYITFNKDNMITQVNNSTELRQALNENLHALLTKKRKLLVAKEVNNTLGKILLDVRMELMNNALTGNKEGVTWFENKQKQIGETYGVVPRIKYAN